MGVNNSTYKKNRATLTALLLKRQFCANNYTNSMKK